MHSRKYIEEIGSAAMQATKTDKRLTGVAPEVNLMECITCTPLPSANKAAHFGFETQRRSHQKSKNRGISGSACIVSPTLSYSATQALLLNWRCSHAPLILVQKINWSSNLPVVTVK